MSGNAWLDLLAVVGAAVLGWLTRHWGGNKKPPEGGDTTGKAQGEPPPTNAKTADFKYN